MTHDYNTKFKQWLWDNHRRIKDTLTWGELNKFKQLYESETSGERWTRIIESMQKEESV